MTQITKSISAGLLGQFYGWDQEGCRDLLFHSINLYDLSILLEIKTLDQAIVMHIASLLFPGADMLCRFRC